MFHLNRRAAELAAVTLGSAILCWYAGLLTWELVVGRRSKPVPESYLVVGLAAGLAFLLAFFSGRPPNAVNSSTSRGSRFRHSLAILLGLINAAAFVGAAIYIRSFDVLGEGFTKTGFEAYAYIAARCLMVAQLFIAFCTAGWFIQARFARSGGAEPLPRLIESFFLGTVLYAFLSTGLGFLGILNTYVATAVMAPPLVLSPLASHYLRATKMEKLNEALVRRSITQRILFFFLCSLFGAMVLTLLFARGLFPVTLDGDIWEHYLHFYRDVIRSGEIRPTEVWYHYFLSKGAGLFYMVGAVSDVFSAQLVSICLLFASLIICIDFLRKLTGTLEWALCGAIVISSAILFEYDTGAFFKHHIVFLGFATFLVWSIWRSLVGSSRPPLLATGMLCGAYVGFYETIPATLLVLFFALLTLLLWPRTDALLDKRTLSLGIAIGAGVAASLFLNYVSVGMAEMTPTSLFWSLADKSRFEQSVGPSGVLYFLSMGSDISPNRDWTGTWLSSVFRYSFFRSLFSKEFGLLIGCLVVANLLYRRNNDPLYRHRASISVLAAFLISAIAFAQVAQVGSTYRLFIFTIPVVTVACICAAKESISKFVGEHLRSVATAAVMVLLATVAVGRGWSGVTISGDGLTKYFAKGISLQETFEAVEPLRSAGSDVGIQFITEARRMIGRDARILSLGYDPGFYYSAPGVGIVSEPTYSLGDKFLGLAFGEPGEVKHHLAALGIRYLLLDLKSPLFSAVAHGRLLGPTNAADNLRVVMHRGDTYLLSWNEREGTAPLPERFLRIIELKRSGALFYPFSRTFCERLRAMSDSYVPLLRAPSMEARIKAEEDLVESVVKSVMSNLEAVKFPGNRAIIGTITLAVRTSVREALSEKQKLPEAASDLAARVVSNVRKATFDAIEAEFGRGIAEALSRWDERVPFGFIYESREGVHDILAGGLRAIGTKVEGPSRRRLENDCR